MQHLDHLAHNSRMAHLVSLSMLQDYLDSALSARQRGTSQRQSNEQRQESGSSSNPAFNAAASVWRRRQEGECPDAEHRRQGAPERRAQDPVSTLEDYRQAYYEFSGKASDIARTLALSGLAIIWIFNKSDGGGGLYLPREFFAPAIWLVLALAFDLLQYVVAAFVWGTFHRVMEKRRRKSDDLIVADSRLTWPQNTFFGLKLLAVAIAYVQLLQFLWRQLHPG